MLFPISIPIYNNPSIHYLPKDPLFVYVHLGLELKYLPKEASTQVTYQVQFILKLQGMSSWTQPASCYWHLKGTPEMLINISVCMLCGSGIEHVTMMD